MKAKANNPDEVDKTVQSKSQSQPASSRIEIGEDGIPVIQCAPDAPATRMSMEELLALEQ